jgi:photosystem II stability/assembly factor-like uncharacterized protein
MTRIEAARRRLQLARYAITVSAVALFAVVGAAVRASHPATQTSSQPATAASSTSTSDQSFFSGGDDGYSVGPSGSAQPSIQSSGS